MKPVSHVHMTFTIPKIIRGFFKRNRKLLKLLPQSAYYAIEKYYQKALGIEGRYTGGVFCIQSQGSLLNFHPHTHSLILAGIIKEGTFYEQINISTEIIAQLFRARLLSVLLRKGVIRQELIDLLMSWNHTSGFNVHSKGKINYIPSPYECITIYYGVYSSSYRGKEKRENIDEAAVKVEEAKGKGTASSTWARLIQKIFEIGPLLCPQCGK
ncbi:MAG: transposase [bacterium]